MKYKYEYKSLEERELLITTNSNLVLIEEQNITGGNFLIFVDKQTQQENQEIQELNNRISDISTYLSNLDANAIADIENSIFEIEKNKILEGMM